MKHISTTQKIFLLMLVVFAASLFGYTTLYRHIQAQQLELVRLEGELHSVDEVSEKQTEIKHFLKNTEQQREELKSYFVSAKDPTSFLEQIDSAAEYAGVLIEVSRLESVSVPEDRYIKSFSKDLQQEMHIGMSVEGVWSSVYHFLLLLEEFPFLVSVQQIALTQEGDGDLWGGQVHIIANVQ